MNWSYESDKRILITYEGGTLTSGDVVAGSFSLTERLCSFDQLEIGSCEASELRFSVSNPDVKLKGKAITVEFFNPDQPNNKYTLGHYTVETDKAIEKRTQREIVAYDDMYWLAQLNVTSWLASFFGTSASKTVSELVSSLGTKIGKTIPIPSAVASYKVYKTDTLFAVMATDVLRALGELIGGSYRIGRDGNLKFVNLLTTPTYTTYEVGKVVDAEYEEYTVGAITKVVIQNNNEDVSKTAGGGTNAYTITGNMLLSDDGITESGQDYANRLWQGLGGLTYVPFNAEVVANPEVEVGSGVTITFRDGSTISSIIFERTLNGIQGMTDSFSADGKETREIESGIQTAITSLGQQTAEISSTVDGLSSTVGKFSSTYVSQSVYEQDSKTIGLKVEEIERNITSLEEEIDGEVEVYNLDYEPTFSKNADDTLVTANYPAITFTYNIYVHPDEATLINGNIPFLYKDEYLQKNSRDLAFNTTDGQSYRFVKEDGAYHWKPIADTDFGIAMQRIAELTVESGKIESRVAETETAITAQGKQITQNTSDIKQTAHSIDLTVSDSTGKTTGIRIALKDKDGNEISHNEGNIVLSGDVVVKGNLSDGTTTISGSNITTGTINCDNVTLSNLKWASVTDHPTSLSEFSNATTGYQTAQNVETIVSNDLTTYTTNVVNKKLTAKVEDATSNASWDLSSTAFSVSSKGNEVLRVDGSGLNVNGKGTFSGDISAAKITVGGVAKGTSEAVTAITESTITTTSVTANNLKVKAANVDGKLTAKQIDVNDLFAQDITASNLHITDGTIDIANGAFKVDYHGYLEAQDADITGKITSSDATITGGTVQIETATGGLDSYITLNDVYQQTQNKVTVSPRAITAYGKQANSNAYKEVRISGYSESFAISVEARDGENNESTYIDAGEIEINGEQVLVPSSLEWIAQTLSITNGQSKQFFKGTYKTLVLEGYVSGSAPYQTITIPIRTITTSAKSYGISWGTSTLTAKVSLVSNNIKVECVSSGYGVWANAYLRR